MIFGIKIGVGVSKTLPMKKHTKIYMDYFGYDISDFIPCEVCGAKCQDVHHVDIKGMGGSHLQDRIDNLIGLCRLDHERAHGTESKYYKELFKEIISKR